MPPICRPPNQKWASASDSWATCRRRKSCCRNSCLGAGIGAEMCSKCSAIIPKGFIVAFGWQPCRNPRSPRSRRRLDAVRESGRPVVRRCTGKESCPHERDGTIKHRPSLCAISAKTRRNRRIFLPAVPLAAIASTIHLGLLPRESKDRVEFVGNTSKSGTRRLFAEPKCSSPRTQTTGATRSRARTGQRSGVRENLRQDTFILPSHENKIYMFRVRGLELLTAKTKCFRPSA